MPGPGASTCCGIRDPVVNVFMPTALGSITSALVLKSGGKTPGKYFSFPVFIHPDDPGKRVARAYSDSNSPQWLPLTSWSLRGAGRRMGNYRWFPISFSIRCTMKRGQLMRWYIVSTDIDERKRAEEKTFSRRTLPFAREKSTRASMFEEIIGTSAPLKAVLSRISKVAAKRFLRSLSRVKREQAKELVARAIHRRSKSQLARIRLA